MAYRYEFTFDRHSELSNEIIQNIRFYLSNLTDGRIAWNQWSIPDEMALYHLEQNADEDEEIPLEPNRCEPIRVRVAPPPLEEIRQAFEVSQPVWSDRTGTTRI